MKLSFNYGTIAILTVINVIAFALGGWLTAILFIICEVFVTMYFDYKRFFKSGQERGF